MKKPILSLILMVFFLLEGRAVQFQDVDELSTISASSFATGEKPQSKVWTYNGKHWAVISSNAGTRLFRLDGTNWTSILTLTSETAKADSKVVGNKVYVLLHYGSEAQLATLTFSGSSYQHSAMSDEISLDDDAETATFDIDGTGRMWIAFNGDNDDDDPDLNQGPETDNVYVRWSDAPYNDENGWSERYRVETNIDGDDLAVVVALPGKIGVLWSNQMTGNFGFRTHQDGASPTSWSGDEVPVLSGDPDFSDDHVNVAVASDGTLYCAVKTSYDSSNEPAIALMVRRPSGNWDRLYDVASQGTRPIVILNEGMGIVRVIYTAQNSGGDILYRESSIQNISFGSARTLIDGTYDNSSSIKGNYNSEVVILASDDSRVVGVLATDAYTPPLVTVPQLFTPEDDATGLQGTIEFTWEDTGADSYVLQIASSQNFSDLLLNQQRESTSSTYSDFEWGEEYFWRVRANLDGEESSWSQIRNFSMLPALAEAPSLESPTNGADGLPVDLMLDWSEVDGSEGYDLQVSMAADFSGLLVDETDLTATEFNLDGLSNDTEYFWRVRAVNAAGDGEWANASFTTIVAIAGAPDLVNPSNGADGLPVELMLDWANVNGAEAYDLQVSTVSSFNDLVVDESGLTASEFELENLSNGTEYFWRVRAVNAAGDGEWANASFTTIVALAGAPDLVNPSNGADGLPVDLMLDWSEVEGSEGYDLQVSMDVDFSGLLVDESGLTASEFDLESLSNGTEYFWRVRAVNAAGEGEWASASFTTIVALAGAPTIEYPSHGADGLPVDLMLDWSEVNGSEGYDLQVSMAADFSGLLVDESGLTASEFDLESLSNGTEYFWRVRAVNAAGEGEWASASFTTIVALAGAPDLENPSNGADGLPVELLLDWSEVDGSDGYDLQVSMAADFSGLLVDESGLTASEFDLDGLSSGTEYFWRVRAVNAAGEGEWASASFTTIVALAGVPSLESPTHEANGLPVELLLDWSEVDGSEGYDLQVSMASDFSGLLVDETGLTATEFNLDGLSNGTEYFWRVRAVNAAGDGDWASASFTTIVAIAGAPDLENPSNGADGLPVDLMLDWSEVEGSEGYDLQVSMDVDFSGLLVDETDLTATEFILDGLSNGTEYFWRVRAVNSVGEGEWSETWSFSTSSPSEGGDLVGHWKMEESDGTTIMDSSGYGNDASLFGNPASISGMEGLALNFDGNDYMIASDHNSLDLSGPLTIATWVRPEKQATQYLVKKAVQNGTDGYELSLSSGGKIFFRYNQGTSGNSFRLDSQDSYPTDGATWLHVAVTFNGSEMRIYLDGVLNSSRTFTTAPLIHTNTLDLSIGAGPDGYRGITGAMDDVRIYRTALTETEVNQLTFPSSPSLAEAPQQLLPENGSGNISLSPVLSWEISRGAESYDLQVSADAEFSEIFLNVTELMDTSFELSDLVEETEFFWRVRAVNSVGEGEWSETWSFSTAAPSEGGDLVGHWKMEDAVSTLLDDSGYNNDAVLFGNPASLAGMEGQALDFDGNDYAVAPDNNSLDLTGSLTIATWIRPERRTTQYLVKKAEMNATDGYELSLSSGGKIFFRYNQDSSGNSFRLDSQDSYPTDGSTWMHVAVTFNGSEMRIYLDGVLNSSRTFTGAPVVSSNTLDLSIGAGADGYRGLEGAMDDVRIYKVALSSTEVDQLATFSSVPSLADAPELTLPANGAGNVSLSPVLSWNISGGAEEYTLEVSESETFDSIVFGASGISLTSIQAEGLIEETQYYWRVRAVNSVGESAWSETWSFSTTAASEGGDLVGHWKMDENSGSVLMDSSGYENDASISGGPAWIAGMEGQALDFDGNGYAVALDNNSLDLSGSLTIATWIRPERRATQYLVKKADMNATDGYELSLSSGGKIFFRYNQNSSGNSFRLDSQDTYPTDGSTWMHVAVTFNGAEMRIYLDGVLNSSRTFTTAPVVSTNTLDLSIGAGADGYRGLVGAMDDVRIYRTALAEGEIGNLTSAPVALKTQMESKRELPEQKEIVVGEFYATPNPFETETTIHLSYAEDQEFEIGLFDMNGRRLFDIGGGKALADERYMFNLSGYSLGVGVYFVRLETRNGPTKTIQILKSR